MKIGDISKLFNISIETLRYYEKLGLLTPKRIKKHRDYTENDVKKIRTILALKKMLFSLDEINCILLMDEKIEAALNNKYVDKDNVNKLFLKVKSKYTELLEIEENINNAKKQLEEIIDKVKVVIEE